MKSIKIILGVAVASILLAGCRGNNPSATAQEVKNTANAQGNQAVQAADYASACESSYTILC